MDTQKLDELTASVQEEILRATPVPSSRVEEVKRRIREGLLNHVQELTADEIEMLEAYRIWRATREPGSAFHCRPVIR
jgi:hypothetical protein